MNAVCKCRKCGAVWSCRARDDPDTNALELTGDQQDCPECGGEDVEVVDVAYDDPEPPYGDFF